MTVSPASIRWDGARFEILDQRLLPDEVRYVEMTDLAGVHAAIRTLAVRGAPAIGIAAAYGVVVSMRPHAGERRDAFLARLDEVCACIADARPTAVNLGWATRRMRDVARSADDPGGSDSDTTMSLPPRADCGAAMSRVAGPVAPARATTSPTEAA